MAKTDGAVRGLVVAAIRRHSMEMDAWANTRLWEQGADAVKALLIADASLGSQAHELFEIATGDGVVQCPYETGKQSMGTIYALQTLR